MVPLATCSRVMIYELVLLSDLVFSYVLLIEKLLLSEVCALLRYIVIVITAIFYCRNGLARESKKLHHFMGEGHTLSAVEVSQ